MLVPNPYYSYATQGDPNKVFGIKSSMWNILGGVATILIGIKGRTFLGEIPTIVIPLWYLTGGYLIYRGYKQQQTGA